MNFYDSFIKYKIYKYNIDLVYNTCRPICPLTCFNDHAVRKQSLVEEITYFKL